MERVFFIFCSECLGVAGSHLLRDNSNAIVGSAAISGSRRWIYVRNCLVLSLMRFTRVNAIYSCELCCTYKRADEKIMRLCLRRRHLLNAESSSFESVEQSRPQNEIDSVRVVRVIAFHRLVACVTVRSGDGQLAG